MADWLMIASPPGDPEQIGSAAAKLRAGAEEFALLADEFRAAARAASATWSGTAAASFASTSGPVGGHLADAASAHGRIAAILGGYRDALEGAQSAAARAQQQISEALNTYAGRGRAVASDIADELERALPETGIGPMATMLIARLRAWDLPPGFAPYVETGALPPPYFPPSAIVADLSGPAGAGLSAQLMEMPLFVLDLVGVNRSNVAALEEETGSVVSAAQSSLRNALFDLRGVAERAGSGLLEVGEHSFARVPDPEVLGPAGGSSSFASAGRRSTLL